MDRRRALESARHAHADPALVSSIEQVLSLLAPSALASDALSDRGYVLSRADGDDSFRGFHDVHCGGEGLSPRAFRALAESRLLQFRNALDSLSGRDRAFATAALDRLRPRLAREARPPWPFFGWKVPPNGPPRLTLYLVGLSAGLGSSSLAAGLLEDLGLRFDPASEPAGTLDCFGVTFSSDGRVEAKVYERVPPPSDRASLEAVIQVHGRAGAAHLRWWTRLQADLPSRFWTRARRYSAEKGRSPVKTEIHFHRPVEPVELLAAEAPDPWLAEAMEAVRKTAARVTCLAVEGDRPFVYFG
jgi:hypothetical protein